ncbi:Beta-ketoacyl synthase domain-containing protein [Colletotrichum higginsianum IMI 349063]|uniref:Beta-ketoacyl synthase domain-containing protein n=2 Tax=Colletotrichum higginsianum (strain IMI 349063) TaxID=759273 RepID=A0A1B7XYC4_COLHI|nr:Beta-ketoacyl synthase domain-containing protein [Colletotrichum higginsianum IMI 349063]OBR04783.1 Beta-ketoacyl synthase domain-containing protein [Colletotrichum higginsianum IMI 349063]
MSSSTMPPSSAEQVMPIAIVGIAGRFPGDAENPQKLWDMLAEGRSALSDVPGDRFNVDAFYHPHNERQGTINVRKAHFMNRDISAFDAPFFNMPIAEAKAMDPQQRMALECTYEALENAGIAMENVDGSNTSCFVGCFTRDYSDMLACDREDLPLYHGTGTGSAIMSNRISWFFNMKGPSISLDTACSSSMAALHLGCQSLRTGETTMSVVGGTNLMLLPDIMGAMTRLHFLSPDGKCQSFDHKGNGYARGEGAGFCILKPLHLALKDGDVIRGVIRNTAVNQDGHTPGITLPAADAQEALIRRIYAEAGLSLADTTYVEAHGTGTPAGDPVEAAALAATFGSARRAGDPVYMGSVKSNVGHLEGGSGLVQVIKAVLMLEQGKIPPSLYYEKPNPRIPMDDWNLRVPTELLPWPAAGLRRISINSFGYGGTNAHCILDDAYHYLKANGLTGNHNVQVADGASPTLSDDSGVSLVEGVDRLTMLEGGGGDLSDYRLDAHAFSSPKPQLLTWSSHDQAGIGRTSTAYASYLASKLGSDEKERQAPEVFERLVNTLTTRRSRLPWKSFAIASSCKQAVSALEEPVAEPVRSANGKKVRLAFVFTGQGAQWFAMGRELFSTPVFRESIEAADSYMREMGASWSLVAELWRDEATSQVGLAHISQPVCTALQVALVDLLRHWNVVPGAVIGHSSGEIAAAYAKGALTRRDAWAIAYHRGRLVRSVKLDGAMLATSLGPEEAESYIERHASGRTAVVACVNSPSSTTLSGDADAIDELFSRIKDDGHFARKLKVDVAYHSPHMQAVAEEYRRSLAHVAPLVPEDPRAPKMFSSLRPGIVASEQLGPDYWVDNMVSRVDFSGGMMAMMGGGAKDRPRAARRTAGGGGGAGKKAEVDNMMIEIGPHGALHGPLHQIFTHGADKNNSSASVTDLSYRSVLERGKNAAETALTLAGKLFQLGYPIDIEAVNGNSSSSSSSSGSGAFLVDLPPFSWNHELKYWSESHTARAHRFRKHPRKDLFGSETLEAIDREPRYRNILKLAEVPWVQYHKVQGSILYPAAGMMIMAIEALCQKADENQTVDGYELRDVIIGKALVVPQDEDGVETMLTVKPSRLGSRTNNASSVWQEFQLYSRKESWELNCSGLIRIRYEAPAHSSFADEDRILAGQYAEQARSIAEACSRHQNPRQFYGNLESIGLHYGPVFQGLTSIRKGDHQAACTIEIQDTRATMPHKFEYPHVIHPATLDSVIQMALPSCSAVDEDLSAAMVPTSIGRLYVSASMPSTPGVQLPGFSCAKDAATGGREGLVVLADEGWSKPLVVFEGIKSASLASSSSMADGNAADMLKLRKLTSVFHWQQDISMLEPAQIRKLCAERVGDLGQVDRSVLQELEMACLIYIKRVMRECPAEEAASFAWNFKLYWEYMKRCYEMGRRGELCYQSAGSESGSGSGSVSESGSGSGPGSGWLDMTPEAEAELLARVSRSSTDGAALVEHGEHLPQILRGEIPPLQILMRDNFLHNFYKDGLGTQQHYAQMAYYVEMMAHKNPNMRILEIGGGTGGASLPVLQALGGGADGSAPRFESYTFTDISAGYFEKAREKLAPWVPFMEFARLNIEEDPAAQQFEEGAYDLVIASNVLHATRFIGKTLENTRKLLKPTGKLVLSEITNPSQKMRFHMIVGSLEGWWYGEEDGRHFGPTLTVDEWDKEMLSSGFTGVDIDFSNFQDERDLSLSVMVTTANQPPAVPVPCEALVVLPNHADSDVSAFAEKLSERLANNGCSVLLRRLHETTDLELQNRSSLLLLDAPADKPFLPAVSAEDWDALRRIVLSSRDAVYVTRGGTVNSENPSANLMSGMARSIRSENPGLGLTTLDVDHDAPMNADGMIEAVYKTFCKACDSKDAERPDWEVAVRDGMPMVQRIVLDKGMNDLITDLNAPPAPREMPFRQEGRPLTMAVGTPGRLDTLHFRDDPRAAAAAAEPLADNGVEIRVRAVGLNFKDVMVAMGQLEQPALGVDCSGIVDRVGKGVSRVRPGDAVMTWKLGTMGNLVQAEEAMVQLVPDGMDLVTAASLPVIYSTAHHAISNVARLREGESLLIHGAAGGVGQASIILAQHVGAKVFATVSSEEKKQLLMTTYGIPAEHIFNSRDTQFAQGVMRLTGSRGVDVVLNSLAGEALRLSWRCIGRFGRFVELGQKDIVGNTGLDMEPFLRNVSFHSVNMLDLLDHDAVAASRVFGEVMDLLRSGVARPVAPVESFPLSRAEEAFRRMQMGKHVGKIVLEARDDDVVLATPPRVAPMAFRPDATYVIAGGSGGLGRCIAEWMARSGARNILMLSRSGDRKRTVRELLGRLEKQGVRAAAMECDVGDEAQLLACLDRCRAESWPRVRGVVQGAMVLNDAIYQGMTRDQFLGATQCKVQGSWHLHEHLPRDMDFFVLLSSSVGIAGSRAQGNYSAGNAYQDALAHHRRGRGLPACSIDVGMVLGVGFLAEETTGDRVHENTRSWSFIGIREREFLAILQAAMTGESAAAATAPTQMITGLGTGGMMALGSEKYPWWFNDAKFAHIVQVDTHHVVQEKNDDAGRLRDELAAATGLEGAAEVVAAALVQKLARSMMVSAENIETSRPVSSYGVDSLLAVELRSWIYEELQADVSVFDLLSNVAISSLARTIVAGSKVVSNAVKEA